MSRELKFRAWDTVTNEMYSHEQLRTPYGITGTSLTFREFTGFGNHGVVVMQYTGLCDSLGQDLYEGDIIESACGDGKWVVAWWAGNARFVLADSLPVETAAKEEVIIGTTDRIIGNIFEHSHLLNEDQP